jgi:hypothetical protein
MSHLDTIKKKYNFNQINVATWRDPRLSVHPARGGPKPRTVAPEAVSQTFVPRYRVSYKLPQPPTEESSSDDESSDAESEAGEEAAKADQPNPEGD